MNYSSTDSKVSSRILKMFFASTLLVLILSMVISAGGQDRKQDPAQPQIKQRTLRIERVKPEKPANATKTETEQQPLETTAENSVTTSIPCTSILFLGDVQSLVVRPTGYQPNSTETFTTVQTNPGVVGFSDNQAGPFVESFQFSVTMDSSGSGFYSPLYVKGLTVGFTTTSLTSPNTTSVNTIDFNVINHCNCPPIPVIP